MEEIGVLWFKQYLFESSGFVLVSHELLISKNINVTKFT